MNPSLLRRSLSSAVAVLIGVAAISCSDVLYGSRRIANVSLQPRFSQHDAEIYQSLRTFNLGATTLHVVLVRPETDTLADTTIAIADGQDSVEVVIPVEIAGSEEILNASMEMWSGSVLIFSGSVSVLAKAGADPTAEAPVLVPVWVGPGADVARVSISPGDTTISASAHLPLAAIAYDASDNVVESAEFQAHSDWAVLEPSLGSIPEHGGDFVGNGARGVAHVTVFTPNLLRDTVAITLVPPPTQVVTISGDNQSGNGGEVLPLPFVVEVRAADNLPVPNTVVRFSAVSGGGTVAIDSAMTDAQGRAQTSLTLGSAAGTNTYQAVVEGIAPATITATAAVTRVATTLSVISGGGQTGGIGTQLAQPYVVQVLANDGLPFAGSVVTFSATSGGGSVNPVTVTTDGQGHAQTTMTLGLAAGTQSFQASVSGLTPVSITATANRVATSLTTISGGGQSGLTGTALAQNFVVEVRAADGLVLAGTVVTFSATSGGGSVNPVTATTNAQGRAQTTMTLGTTAGTQTFAASVSGLTPVTVSETATRVATTLSVISGTGQSGVIGTTVSAPFVVEVRANDGLPMAGTVVTFSSVTGGGSVNPTTATTNAQGRAQTTMTLGGIAGTQTYQASATGLTSVSVNVTATVLPPASITLGGVYSKTVDVGTSSATPATVKASNGTVLDTVSVTYTSRSPSVASVNSSGTVTGLSRGQTILVASVTSNPAIRDSMLVIVADGAILVSSINKFEYATATTVVVSVYVDLHNTGKALGSTHIDVAWDPAQLTYVSHASGAQASPTVNATNAANGSLTFALADVNGLTGKPQLLKITFTTANAAATGNLTLSAQEMTASDLSTNLLPTLVQVTNPLFVH